ncbi:Phospholipase D family [Fagus crenata]
MASEQLMSRSRPHYVQMQSEPSSSVTSSILSPRQASAESTRIFDELPEASIVSVSRPDPDNISPALLSYTIEIQYKQVCDAISLSL